MKRYSLLVLLFVVGLVQVFAQDESEGPLLTNPSLFSKQISVIPSKAHNPIDSTFFYLPDLLSLPFFDDFSTNKFQVYDAQPGDPNVTPEKHYAILENGVPTHPALRFTTLRTYKRTVNLANDTSTDDFFDTLFLDYSDLHDYPIEREQEAYFPGFILIDTIDFPNPVDTIFITDDVIFQDSATIFVTQLNDPEKLWLDKRAYHNYRYADNPFSLGVATFDGLDETGYPYSFGTGGSNYADALTSKPIDLSGFTPADNLYLTFAVQPQGLGEAPEDGDSLILEFYNSVDQKWEWAWSVNGGTNRPFFWNEVRLDNNNLFTNEFQFRFRNYGSIAGAIDHFHLDYVGLKDNYSEGDTSYVDLALIYPLSSLLKDYERVPWDHYKNSTDNKMRSDNEIGLRNNHVQPANNSQGGEVEISYGGGIEANVSIVGNDLSNGDLNYNPTTSYFSVHDFSAAYEFDKSKAGNKQTFLIENQIYSGFGDEVPENDSSFTTQEFYNYYAYDDGTAERAYGPTGSQARLAIQYTPYEAGDIIGAYMHFVPSVIDASNELFVITVWADNNGQPGEVLYEDDLFEPRMPIYEIEQNKFFPYYFKDYFKVPVSGTFYIGWRQFDAERLNIGLDKNIDNSEHTFFSVDNGGSWIQSSIPGSVMIRPIFSTALDAELGIPAKESVEFKLYPNPTNGKVTLEGVNAQSANWQVLDLQGKEILAGSGSSIDATPLNTGIYLIKIEGQAKVLRMVKK